MASPLISVIIPSFNSEKTIRATVASLLQQKFTGFEIVVIDGQSKDNTVSILQEFANIDNRIRFISEKDKGIYDAMNKGIDAAKGAWIYFMGSDDELLNDTVLSTVAPFLQKTDSVFVYGNVLMGDSKHWYDGEFTYEKLLQRNISHQAIFYNKKVVDQAGKYIIRYKTHADWAYNITCFRNKNIHPEYMNVLVARFGLEGVSSQHDVVFLREFLLPARLAYLQEAGVKHLKKISFYDGLWRLFRNAGINTKQQLVEYAANLPVPVPVISMVKVQNKIPAALLKTGVVSKGLMFLNYIFNRITGKL